MEMSTHHFIRVFEFFPVSVPVLGQIGRKGASFRGAVDPLNVCIQAFGPLDPPRLSPSLSQIRLFRDRCCAGLCVHDEAILEMIETDDGFPTAVGKIHHRMLHHHLVVLI